MLTVAAGLGLSGDVPTHRRVVDNMEQRIPDDVSLLTGRETTNHNITVPEEQLWSTTGPSVLVLIFN